MQDAACPEPKRMNVRQLAYGLLSYVPFAPASLYRGTGGTVSAEYCYGIWLRHMVMARHAGMHRFPSAVAELGPGDSIGTGLAALLCGVQRYVALDALAHAQVELNLQVFDRLVELLRARTPVPGAARFPEMQPALEDEAFPLAMIGEDRLREALAPARVAWLRRLVSGDATDRSVLDYRAPWQDAGPAAGSIDFLLSHAVLEHVPEVAGTWEAMATWCAPGAWASHQIDFRSHALFAAWDGHWACPEWLWRAFQGRRAYLLNRLPLQAHLDAAASAGFKIAALRREERAPQSRTLAPRWRGIGEQDRRTAGAYLLVRARDAAPFESAAKASLPVA